MPHLYHSSSYATDYEQRAATVIHFWYKARKKYSAEKTTLYYCLLASQIPQGKIRRIIKDVLIAFVPGVDVESLQLPAVSCANYMVAASYHPKACCSTPPLTVEAWHHVPHNMQRNQSQHNTPWYHTLPLPWCNSPETLNNSRGFRATAGSGGTAEIIGLLVAVGGSPVDILVAMVGRYHNCGWRR